MKQTPETVILIDCGCDGIQKLARAVRDKQIYTMVIPCTAPVERVMAENPVGLVFVSGGNEARLADAQAKFAAVGLPKFTAAGLDDACKVTEFCINECKCSSNWKMETFIEEAVADGVLVGEHLGTAQHDAVDDDQRQEDAQRASFNNNICTCIPFPAS